MLWYWWPICEESWRPQGEPLVVVALPAVVVGLDGQDPVLDLVNAAALVGDGDDVVELLADVGGDGDGGGRVVRVARAFPLVCF